MTKVRLIKLVQFLLISKATAVVGLLILALKANITYATLNLNNYLTLIVIAKLAMAIINISSNGA